MRPIHALLLAILTAGPAGAHDMSGHGTKGHDGHAAAAPSDSPATKAFRAVDARMHRDMAIRYTDDVDADFVRGMIPHHEGAIGMAEVALRYSKDPEIRKLAEDIVRAQQTEIAQMRDFLKRRGGQ